MATLPLILGRAKLTGKREILSQSSYWIEPVSTFSLVDRKTGTIPSVFTRASTATYFDRNGILQTAAVDEPVIEWDPATGACLGWRVWDAVTNGHIYTEDFTNAAWTKFGGSMSANVGPSPDGGTNADGLVESVGVSEGHGFRRTYSYVSGTQITLSVFVSKGSRNFAAVVFGAAAFGGTNTSGFFDLTLGTVTSANNCTAQIQRCPNGVFRCSITATPTVTIAAVAEYRSTNVGNAFTYTGDGSTAGYFWGAQINNGPLAPYVPATGALTASSTADVASITGAAFAGIWNQAAGTIYAEATIAVSNAPVLVPRATASIGDRIQLVFGSPGQSAVLASSVIQASFTPSTASKRALAFAANDFALAYGSTIETDTSGAVPTVDYATIGRFDFGGLQYLNGYIRELAIFKSRRPNSILQALTA